MNAPLVIGRYVMFDAIGGGGMAKVHLGRIRGAAGFSRVVAIKRMHPDRAHDREFATMLVDEARLASRIRHPNVVPVLDVVRSGNELLLIMEYVHGASLDALIAAATARGERLPLPVVTRIALDVLAGLQSAHDARGERGEPLELVHRDISPQNILVGVDGSSRIIDFGIAKAARKLSMTHAGQIKGKLSYMAPEQLRSQPVDRRTDVYAMGLVLWELIVGKRAVRPQANSLPLMIRQALTTSIPDAGTLADVPPALDAVIRRALQTEPEARFPSADAMATALEAACEPAKAKVIATSVASLADETLTRRSETVAKMEELSLVDSVRPMPSAEVVPSVQTELGSVAGSASLAPEAPELRGTTVIGPPPDLPPPEDAVREDVPAFPSRWSTAALVLGAFLVTTTIAGLTLHFVGGRRSRPLPTASARLAASTGPSGAAPPSVTPLALVPSPTETAPEAASKTAPASSVSARPAPTPRRPTPSASAKPPPAPDCDPPYAIDSRGIRIPRRECLQH